MNDDIKEILDNIKKCCEIMQDENFVVYQKQDIIKLLDYINNLQEQLHQASLDIQELTERDIECPSWCDKLTNLQQELEEYKDTETYSKRFLYKANKDRLNANLELVKENERLKTKMKEQSLLLIDYQDMEQKLEDYKSRIEKADWWLREMLRQAKSDETKAIINGTLELLLNGRSDE